MFKSFSFNSDELISLQCNELVILSFDGVKHSSQQIYRNNRVPRILQLIQSIYSDIKEVKFNQHNNNRRKSLKKICEQPYIFSDLCSSRWYKKHIKQPTYLNDKYEYPSLLFYNNKQCNNDFRLAFCYLINNTNCKIQYSSFTNIFLNQSLLFLNTMKIFKDTNHKLTPFGEFYKKIYDKIITITTCFNEKINSKLLYLQDEYNDFYFRYNPFSRIIKFLCYFYALHNINSLHEKTITKYFINIYNKIENYEIEKKLFARDLIEFGTNMILKDIKNKKFKQNFNAEMIILKLERNL